MKLTEPTGKLAVRGAKLPEGVGKLARRAGSLPIHGNEKLFRERYVFGPGTEASAHGSAGMRGGSASARRVTGERWAARKEAWIRVVRRGDGGAASFAFCAASFPARSRSFRSRSVKLSGGGVGYPIRFASSGGRRPPRLASSPPIPLLSGWVPRPTVASIVASAPVTRAPTSFVTSISEALTVMLDGPSVSCMSSPLPAVS